MNGPARALSLDPFVPARHTLGLQLVTKVRHRL
jgi:hypothetical protein